jgi:hypothetical protein
MIRSFSFLTLSLMFVAQAHAVQDTTKAFVNSISEILEYSRYYDGQVEELRAEILATSQCVQVPSEEADEYFYKNVMEARPETISKTHREIARSYFDRSYTFIFCENLATYTRGEHIEYESIINPEARDESFVVVKDKSERAVLDEP